MVGMQAAVVSAAVSGMLKIVGYKLGPLIIKEYSSIMGARKDLEELQDQVEQIRCWLEAAGDNATWNGPSFIWLKKLKDVAYDVDDVVDEFHLKAEKHDHGGDSGIVSKYICTNPKSFVFQCKAASKIKDIKKRFAEIVKQRTDFSAIANSLLVGRPIRHLNKINVELPSLSTVDVASVIGREQEKHQIISKLVHNNDHQRINIVSVVGLGGSGKTTLAQLVFNDSEIVEQHFDVKLWVHVSQVFDVAKLIEKLFEAVASEKSERYPLQQMSSIILSKLTGKRYLLVLDDVWTEDRIQWDQFMVHMKSGTPESSILLTTRSRKVAEAVGSADQFDLPLLSEDYSWQLFQESLAITPAKGLEVGFAEVGKEIVKKCGGVPLAIKVLAGVLHDKKHLEQWQAVRYNNLLGVEGEERRVSACLWLSYLHLPSHLKQCFIICSVFPKGYLIDKERLIDKWIAHDMISPVDGVDYLDYIGYECFSSLIQISFLQVVGEKYGGRVVCRMHDLVHDLARSILDDEITLDLENRTANSTKRSRYFSFSLKSTNLLPDNLFEKARAVYVHAFDNSRSGDSKAWRNAKHLRSVTVNSVNSMWTKPVLTAILEIKNLRYLEVPGLKCKALPEAISDIWSIQALHLTRGDLLELPKSIGKLRKLRALNLWQCKFLKCLPDSIGNCHMISRIDLSSCKRFTVLPNSIGKNEKLRVLRLGDTRIERLPPSMVTLRNLEYLDLEYCRHLTELPQGIGILEKLQVLNLKGCRDLGGMAVGIGQLSRLETLGLFVVGEGEQFARVSELANLHRIGEQLNIRGISHVMDPGDARVACLKQKTELQRLGLRWIWNDVGGSDMGHQVLLDNLEPPPGIKELRVVRYPGSQFAQWVQKQNQVGGGVEGLARFPFLKVLALVDLPNLKYLHGLVELPCLNDLELDSLPSLESISGGPFPSLVRVGMSKLPSLGEVWIVAEAKSMANDAGEEGGGCSRPACSDRSTRQLGRQVLRVGNCVSDLFLHDCPKLEVKPCLPLSLQLLKLDGSSEQLLLQSPCQCQEGQSSSLSRSVSHLNLKELQLSRLTAGSSGCRRGWWELLEHTTAVESLMICGSDHHELSLSAEGLLTELPENMGSLANSLRSLEVNSCRAIRMLPESLGELRYLQELNISFCRSLCSLPQSMGGLTSLQVLHIGWCDALEQLPECLGELRSLRRLDIAGLPALPRLPRSLGRLTSLQELTMDCPRLEQLPECLGELRSLRKLILIKLRRLSCLPRSLCRLTSLEELTIHGCPGIKSLPEGVKGLTALWRLHIFDCPDLARRCERGKGEDWRLVSHIPHLWIS